MTTSNAPTHLTVNKAVWCEVLSQQIGIPASLQQKEPRGPMLARLATRLVGDLFALRSVTEKECTEIGIVGIVDNQENDFLNRVREGIVRNVARQGFFVRAGPQTVSTYPMMAHHFHGAALTLLGTTEASFVHQIVSALLKAQRAAQLIVVCARVSADRADGAALLVTYGREGDLKSSNELAHEWIMNTARECGHASLDHNHTSPLETPDVALSA